MDRTTTAFFKARLAKLLPEAIEDLRRLVLERRLHSATRSLAIELNFERGIPRFVGYELDSTGNQTAVEEDGGFLMVPGFRVFAARLRFFSLAESRKFEPALQAPLFVRWFRQSWDQAGGKRFVMPATLRLHDASAEQRLSKGR